MNSKHPHPLRCHPPTPLASPFLDAMERYKGYGLVNGNGYEGYLDSQSVSGTSPSSSAPPSPARNGFSGARSRKESTVTADLLFRAVPPSRSGLRFADLVSKNGINGQSASEVEYIAKRVFNYLPSKSDERALTLVDTSTFRLLLPAFYHTVTISIGRYPYNLSAVTNMLNKTNPGLCFIKRVIFDNSEVIDKADPPSGFEYLAALIIRNVPQNQLMYFDWPSDYILHPIYTKELWGNQETLRNLAIYDDTLDYNTAEVRGMINEKDILEALRISPDTRSGIRLIYNVLARHAISELHVDLRKYKPNPVGIEYLHGRRRDKVAEHLFKHARPFDVIRFEHQLPLTRLVLWNVNLYRGCQIWLKTIRLNTLKELELSKCAFAGCFLEDLAHVQPFIESIKISHDLALDQIYDDNSTCLVDRDTFADFVSALEDFLIELAFRPAKALVMDGKHINATQGNVKHRLKRLQITLENAGKYRNCFDVIRFHAPALEVLTLDFFPVDGSGQFTTDVIDDGLAECDINRLRQLCFRYDCMPHPNDMAHINPVTLFVTGAQNGKETANRILNGLLGVHGTQLRLRTIAVECVPRKAKDSKQEEAVADTRTNSKHVEYFAKCEATVMGRKKELMITVSYADLKKYETDIDILEPPPMELGNRGRI